MIIKSAMLSTIISVGKSEQSTTMVSAEFTLINILNRKIQGFCNVLIYYVCVYNLLNNKKQNKNCLIWNFKRRLPPYDVNVLFTIRYYYSYEKKNITSFISELLFHTS